MATDAASIGANFSDYQGNAALGGAGMPAFQIDTRPLQQLAQYTFYYKRDEWRQRQHETDAKVKELADLSNIALNDLRGKDKEQMVKEFADLQNYAAEYARKTPKNAQERMQNELEWQSKYGAFKNNYNSGKVRAITYQKLFNDVMNSDVSAKTRDAELEILNKKFQDTDIATPISALQKFKIGSFDVPKPTEQTFTSIGVGPNQNVSYTMSYYNPTTNAGLADAAILGFKKAYPKEGTVEYNNLTQNEKDEAKVQSTIDSGAKGWIDATEPLNAALKNYIKDGVFDATSFENDNASNTTLMSAYNAVKRYGEYNKNKFEQASNRIFSDKGLGVALPENVKADDFKAGFVDFAKGVKTNQLVQAGMFAKFGGDKISEKKIQETDNAIQREQLRISLGNLGLEREKMNKADTTDLLAADGVLREVADIINVGDVEQNKVEVYDPKTGNKKFVFEISDPTVIQKFSNIDKDGNVTNSADRLRFNPKTNELDLVYFERDADDKIIETNTGHKIRDIKPLNARTWVNIVAQRTFGGQDRGGANQLLQNIITKNGGDLYKIAKALGGGTQTQTTNTDDDSKLSDAQYFMKHKKARKK